MEIKATVNEEAGTTFVAQWNYKDLEHGPIPPANLRIIEPVERERKVQREEREKRHGHLKNGRQNMKPGLKEKHPMSLIHCSIFTFGSFQINE